MVNSSVFQLDELHPGELHAFIAIIYKATGIALTDAKKELVSARLHKRLRALGMPTFRKYLAYLRSPEGEKELGELVDVITTNTTQFFREPRHFETLRETVLPTLCQRAHYRNDGQITVWSAGCSCGDEPYTLAMVMADYFEQDTSRFSILATDISQHVLAKARQGIYDADEVEDTVPPPMKFRYLMHGKRSQSGHYRIIPELRDRVTFAYLNLMDDDIYFETPIDIIFCRNVIIYFDEPTRIALIQKFYDLLEPGGYLFIGHSESLHGINKAFKPVEPTVYRKPEGKGNTKGGRGG